MRDSSSTGNAGRSGGWSGESGGSTDAANTTQPFRTTQSGGRSGQGSFGSDRGNGENLVEQAQQTASELAGGVQEKAGEVVSQVKEQAVTRIASQKDQATGALFSVASAIRQTGLNLREQDQTQIAEYTDKIADQVERVTSYLGHRDLNQISIDLQRYARRQPAIFLGGAIALGFLGARFLKSSSQASQQQSAGESGSYSGGYSGNNSNRYEGGTPGEYAGSYSGGYSGGQPNDYAGGSAAIGATYSDIGSGSSGYDQGAVGNIGSAGYSLGSDLSIGGGQDGGSGSISYEGGAYSDTSGTGGTSLSGGDTEDNTNGEQSSVTPYLGPSEA